MNTSVVQRRNGRREVRQGLTLIELVVVLVILVALAGILVPLFPSMIDRAHGASGASNAESIFKQVQMHELMFNEAPNELDSLLDAADGAVVDTIPTSSGSSLIAINVAARHAAALTSAGIDTTYVLRDSATSVTNATFDNYEGSVITITNDDGSVSGTATPGGRVAVLTTDAISRLGLEPDVNSVGTSDVLSYVAFGLGSNSTAIGQSMASAPVRFLNSGSTPVETYARWLLIYKIPRFNGPATLAAIAGVDADGISGLNGHLSTYYEAAQ